MSVHDTQNPESREEALAAAVDAVRGGELIVLPTDTVYGIGADAFTPEAVEALVVGEQQRSRPAGEDGGDRSARDDDAARGGRAAP